MCGGPHNVNCSVSFQPWIKSGFGGSQGVLGSTPLPPMFWGRRAALAT